MNAVEFDTKGKVLPLFVLSGERVTGEASMHLVRVVVAMLAILPLFACDDDQSAQQPANTASPEHDNAIRPPTDALPAAQALMTPDREPTKAGTVAVPKLEVLQDHSYSTGPIRLRLNTDNTFEMTEAYGSERLTGRYIYEQGVLILNDPQGSVGSTHFPVRCQVEKIDVSAFRLAEGDGTCIRFRNLIFRPSTD